MLKKSLLLCLVVLTLLLCFGCTNTSPFQNAKNFRNAEWGMSMDEVIATEKLTPDDVANNYIKYTSDINCFEQPTEIYYMFEDDSLVSGFYFIDSTDDIDKLFTEVNNELSKYYGESSQSDILGRPQCLYRANGNVIVSAKDTEDSYVDVMFTEDKY